MLKTYNINGTIQRIDIAINADNKIELTVYGEHMPYSVTKTINLTYNKCDVIRINKTGISTTNNEMFADCIESLEYDSDMIHAVVDHFIYGIDHSKKNISVAAFVDMFNPLELVDYFNMATHATRQTIIRYLCCDNHTGKMSGMISYSTLVTMNKFCLARMNLKKAVCVHCFAARQLGIYADQLKKLAKAHAIATMCEWSIDDIPVIEKKYKYFRLESFGDINNTLQVRNYNTLASALERQNIPVTLWTKNPGIIQQAINDGMILSDNLVIGLSSLELNTPELEKAKHYSFIRFLFTVYTPEYATAHDIRINCGGRHCLSCLNCYKHVRMHDGLMIINELLK